MSDCPDANGNDCTDELCTHEHVFEISVRSRFVRADWWGEPYVAEVRASSLVQAITRASGLPFRAWIPPKEPDDLPH